VTEPAPHNRFTSPYDARGLPDAVRAIALHCRPDAPQTVSQREFDRARPEVPEHARAPSARQICSRLGVSWCPLLSALFEPSRDVGKFVSHKQRTGTDHQLSEHQIRLALRVVAARLDVPTLRPAQYDTARQQLLAANRRRRHRGNAPILPTVNQLERAAGDWDHALQLAGLQARPPAAGTGSHRSVVSYHEAIRRFLETQGAMPTSTQLERFASAQSFPLPRRPPGGHQQAMLDVQARFLSEGRWAPATYPPKNRRPRYDFEFARVKQAGEVRRSKRRTKEECVAAVIAYLEQLGPGEKVSQKRYGAWAVGTPHPAPSAFGRHGGWTAVLTEARAQRRAAGP
jgi:hypothetical protein